MKISVKELNMNKFLVFGLGKAILDITTELHATQEKIKQSPPCACPEQGRSSLLTALLRYKLYTIKCVYSKHTI